MKNIRFTFTVGALINILVNMAVITSMCFVISIMIYQKIQGKKASNQVEKRCDCCDCFKKAK